MALAHTTATLPLPTPTTASTAFTEILLSPLTDLISTASSPASPFFFVPLGPRTPSPAHGHSDTPSSVKQYRRHGRIFNSDGTTQSATSSISSLGSVLSRGEFTFWDELEECSAEETRGRLSPATSFSSLDIDSESSASSSEDEAPAPPSPYTKPARRSYNLHKRKLPEPWVQPSNPRAKGKQRALHLKSIPSPALATAVFVYNPDSLSPLPFSPIESQPVSTTPTVSAPAPVAQQTQTPPSPTSTLATIATIKPSVAERRRKRVEKLTRTFGETVPPELVLTPPASVSTFSAFSDFSFIDLNEDEGVSSEKVGHKYSRSFCAAWTMQQSLCEVDAAKSTTRGRSMSVDYLNLSSPLPPLREEQTAVTLHNTSIAPSQAQDTQPAPETTSTKKVHRPSTPHAKTFHTRATAANRPPLPTLAAFSNATMPKTQAIRNVLQPRNNDATLPMNMGTNMEWGKRKEAAWSGEWNVQDMDVVVRGLRGLRVR